MISLSVLGNERERTSGTSENAHSRTCAGPACRSAQNLWLVAGLRRMSRSPWNFVTAIL
jgi:hypothetical protein